MKTRSTLCLTALVAAFILHPSPRLHGAGSLTPPGAPAPTMKSLDEIEPRTPVSSLPYTISTDGSYYVTGNLTVAAASNGITITASNVTLDLGGFQVRGPGGAVGTGVRVVAGATNVVVRNGTVSDWAEDGVGADLLVSTEVQVEHVRAIGNGGRGIALGNDGTATGCTARANVSHGIFGGAGCHILACTASGQAGAAANGIHLGDRAAVRDCVAARNGADGITVGAGSVATGCTAAQNTGTGIVVGVGSTLSDCVARLNTGNAGIETGNGCTITGCTVEGSTSAVSNFGALTVGNDSTIIGCTVANNSSNGLLSAGLRAGSGCLISRCLVSETRTTAAPLTSMTGMGISLLSSSTIEHCTVQGSHGDGIRFLAQCVILGNTCIDSGSVAGDGAGIHALNSENRIEGNSVIRNTRGIQVVSTGSLIIKNSAATNTTDYVIAAGNRYGAIINITAAGGAAVNGNSAASVLTSTDPWANFSY